MHTSLVRGWVLLPVILFGVLSLFLSSPHEVHALTLAETCQAQHSGSPPSIEYFKCLAEGRLPAFIASSTAQLPVVDTLTDLDQGIVQSIRTTVLNTISEETRLLSLIRSSTDREEVRAAWLSANQDHEVFTLLIPKVNAAVAANNGIRVASTTLLFTDRVLARIQILEKRGVPADKVAKLAELKSLEQQIRTQAVTTKKVNLDELNTILSAGVSRGDSAVLAANQAARVAARTRMKDAVTALSSIRQSSMQRALALYEELNPRVACTLQIPAQTVAGRAFSLAWNTSGFPTGGSILQGATVVRNTITSFPSGRATTTAPRVPGSYTYTMTVTKGGYSINCEAITQVTLPRVRMSDYFPTGPLTKNYKTQNGKDYLTHVIEPKDDRLALVPQTQPGTHYMIHDWIRGYYTDTWHMLNGTDGSVSEIADSFAATSTCSYPCYGRIARYNDRPIGHGPAGTMDSATPAFNNYIRMWYSPDGVQPFTAEPGMNAWSSVKIEAVHETYTPEYGSAKPGGVFGVGGGKTYANVVQVIFGHGTQYPAEYGFIEPRCSNQPASMPHVEGYSSFWQRAWLAPGVGWIKIENLFYEGYCGGTLGGRRGDTADNWTAYLNTMSDRLPFTTDAGRSRSSSATPTQGSDKSIGVKRVPDLETR